MYFSFMLFLIDNVFTALTTLQADREYRTGEFIRAVRLK